MKFCVKVQCWVSNGSLNKCVKLRNVIKPCSKRTSVAIVAWKQSLEKLKGRISYVLMSGQRTWRRKKGLKWHTQELCFSGCSMTIKVIFSPKLLNSRCIGKNLSLKNIFVLLTFHFILTYATVAENIIELHIFCI